MKSDNEKILLNYIRASALSWMAYKRWVNGALHHRQHYMKIHMKDMVLGLALLHGERRKVKS